MLKAHPYEEVAYDLYKLENKGSSVGLGRIATLNESISLRELSIIIKQKLNMEHIRVTGNLNDKISKVAVVTGSGADMFKKAQRNGADVLITGDMKYHDAQDALDIGMNVIDCGHFDTENIFKDAISIYLTNIEEIDVIKSDIDLNPFKII
ncbi:Nif3-like dinuclear metal center hexameric protein [Romboutsia sp. 13368]|uniref:Nif3-like dinuclear metal center hexameric protein n=1 Tax=Romboutsia sp. 13368 TaxID=2708053 RepID=UPI0025E0AE28|nr:Nif3-like dinuclear metal center hexameric protein [Romboutsia sp. 13368]